MVAKYGLWTAGCQQPDDANARLANELHSLRRWFNVSAWATKLGNPSVPRKLSICFDSWM